MSIEEIRSSDSLFLTPNDVAGVLCCDPQNIRDQAQKDPSKLGFPVSVIRKRVHIPRVAFLAWFDGGK